MNHGFGTVNAFFIVAAKPSVMGKPAKGAFNHPTSGYDLKQRLPGRAAYKLWPLLYDVHRYGKQLHAYITLMGKNDLEAFVFNVFLQVQQPCPVPWRYPP